MLGYQNSWEKSALMKMENERYVRPAIQPQIVVPSINLLWKLSQKDRVNKIQILFDSQLMFSDVRLKTSKLKLL